MVRYSLFTRKKIIFVLILVILFFITLNIKFSKKNYALDIVKINQILLENDNQRAFLNEASEKSLINKLSCSQILLSIYPKNLCPFQEHV